jgi:hypothetical protein
MSALKTSQIQSLTGAKILGTTGGILQVVQAVKTDTFATTPGAVWANVAGLTATITPTSTSNKILVIADVKGSGTATASIIRSRLLRNYSPIYTGDASGSRPLGMGQAYYDNVTLYIAQLGGTFLDSPNTVSPVIYNIQIGGDATGSTLYINRTQNDRDTGGFIDSRIASSITLIEVTG